jgi:PhnB protein
MKISLQLSFNGQCAEAFADYARIFNGTIVFQMKYRDSPAAAEVPATWQDKLYHATLTIAGITVLGSDVLPADHRAISLDSPLVGAALVVNPDGRDEADRIFAALAAEGVVKMPLQETFWAAAFGVVVDRFGVEWSINCEAIAEAS